MDQEAPRLSLKVLACAVAQRELCYLAATAPHLITLEFLPVGHHDDPERGQADLQNRVDAVPPGKFDAILIGYGLCSRMLAGLAARHTRLIIPRAHDCLTFFLGSKERYLEIFQACPGTFFFTAGWLEFNRRKTLEQAGLEAFRNAPDEAVQLPTPFFLGQSWTDLTAKYGEENACYLRETTQHWACNYQTGALIAFDWSASMALGERVQALCQSRGWHYHELPGDLNLLQRWLAGNWDPPAFLEVGPGQTVYPTYDERLIAAR